MAELHVAGVSILQKVDNHGHEVVLVQHLLFRIVFILTWLCILCISDVLEYTEDMIVCDL